MNVFRIYYHFTGGKTCKYKAATNRPFMRLLSILAHALIIFTGKKPNLDNANT
jgi:hypothetical protein